MGAKELIKRLCSAEKFTIDSFTCVIKGLISMKHKLCAGYCCTSYNVCSAASLEGKALLVSLHRGVVLHHFNFRQPVHDIKYSPDGRLANTDADCAFSECQFCGAKCSHFKLKHLFVNVFWSYVCTSGAHCYKPALWSTLS